MVSACVRRGAVCRVRVDVVRLVAGSAILPAQTPAESRHPRDALLLDADRPGHSGPRFPADAWVDRGRLALAFRWLGPRVRAILRSDWDFLRLPKRGLLRKNHGDLEQSHHLPTLVGASHLAGAGALAFARGRCQI